MKRLLENWKRTLRESYEEPSEYEELLATIEPGLVFNKVDKDEQMMLHPDGDHFVDWNDDPIEFDANQLQTNYEPVAYEFLNQKWHQILSDYEVVYPFSIEHIWNEERVLKNSSWLKTRTLIETWEVRKNIAWHQIYMSQTDAFSTEKDDIPFKRSYQVSWNNRIVQQWDLQIPQHFEVEIKRKWGKMQITQGELQWAVHISGEVNMGYSDYDYVDSVIRTASPLAQEYFKVLNGIMNFHLPQPEK